MNEDVPRRRGNDFSLDRPRNIFTLSVTFTVKQEQSMNYGELITIVQDRVGLSKTQAAEAVGVVMDEITGTLANGEPVRFAGFGSFELAARKSRKARNPQTGGEIQIPARTVVKFKPGAKLKEAVSNLRA